MNTPDQLVAYITSAQAELKLLQQAIDSWKSHLSRLHDEGDIPDKLSTPHGTATLTTRSTWTYSPAVKQLQELEQLDGSATKKITASWTIRPITTEQPDF
jgi:hypothetical protein